MRGLEEQTNGEDQRHCTRMPIRATTRSTERWAQIMTTSPLVTPALCRYHANVLAAS